MNKRGYILAVSLMFLGLAVSAQTYDQVFGSNFWNMSENITGVRQDTVSRSYAEIYGKYTANMWAADSMTHGRHRKDGVQEQ